MTAGLAVLKPAGIRGEIGVGLTWMQPFDDLVVLGIPLEQDQFGVETYWKLLLTPDLWITPGVQFIWDPSLNPNTDFVTVSQFKFRVFL